MTELKGKISVDGTISITCCDSLPRVLVDDTELHSFISDLCGLYSPIDNDEYFTNESVRDWQIEYCISDDDFTESTFEECSANKVFDMLYSSEIYGCYSVWTCGSGGYDYLLGSDTGHSLLQELASFDGKYVWISFGESKIEVEK